MRTVITILMVLGMYQCSQAQMNDYLFNFEQGQPWDISMYPDLIITNHTVADDEVLPAKIKIPFTFNFNGAIYDSVGISENGFVWFGHAGAAEMKSIANPVSSPHSASGIVAALGTDMHPRTGNDLPTSIRSGMTGTTPMRELIIEWKNTSRAGALASPGGADTITFQIKLYEFMHRIEVAYITSGLNHSLTSTAQVGLRGADGSIFHNRNTDNGAGWHNSNRGNSNSSSCELSAARHPLFGHMYVWMNPNLTGIKTPVTTPMLLYPIPATDVLHIGPGSPAQRYTIYNATGEILEQHSGTGNDIPVGNLEAGLYLLAVETADGIFTGRFLKR